MNGYRSSGFPDNALPPPEKWPSRETALDLIDALQGDKARDWHELEKLTGIPDVSEVIRWCFTIYGYRELSPKATCLWLREGTMAPPRAGSASIPSTPEPSVSAPPKLAYGFNR